MGENCKYNGGNNNTKWVVDFAEDKNIIAVCPEELAGMSIPRVPSEQIGDKVFNKDGVDVSEYFINGSETGFNLANEFAKLTGEKLEGAILKANSPSCGCGFVYDGSFSGKKIKGDGYFTKKLKEARIPVITEEDSPDLFDTLKGELL